MPRFLAECLGVQVPSPACREMTDSSEGRHPHPVKSFWCQFLGRVLPEKSFHGSLDDLASPSLDSPSQGSVCLFGRQDSVGD